MGKKPKPRSSGSSSGWIRKKVIINWRTGRPMSRADGKDFIIPIRRKKK